MRAEQPGRRRRFCPRQGAPHDLDNATDPNKKHNKTSTTQLARDAETTRRQMAASLTELRARLSPRSLQDEAVRAISNSGPARFATGLQDEAVNNAVPIAMLAV